MTAPTDRAVPDDATLREVALTRDEYHHAFDLLDRAPNAVELGIIGGMWSEHCGYKHSRPLLRRFPGSGPRVLIGPGEENAGAVDIGDGLAIVMKVESHNHPSAVEPFQGAATGVGGILRDIFTMGARPIAILDSLRFGSLDDARSRFLANGVVGGIAWYGNCVGVPTVGGEIQVAPCYAGNPLVNAMCAGLIRHEDLTSAAASGPGNPLILVGTDTGRDGIHGATFASVEDPEASHRGVVQVGNPFMEKLLLEACLEALTTGGVAGLQDLGATGLTSATIEAAERGGCGVTIDVARVSRRADRMTPYEVMLSESQERMLVVAHAGREDDVRAVFTKWGLHSDVIGHVADGQDVRVTEDSLEVAQLPVSMLVDAPTYEFPVERPAYLDDVQRLNVEDVPEPENLSRTFLTMLASPNIASRRGVYRQYDHMVGTRTMGPPGGDAAVMRIKGTDRAIALCTDGNARHCYLDPFHGGAMAVAEAARNVSCTGATPLAITNCLNFGSPEDPAVYFQLARVIDGMTAACKALGTPVVSGNVSLYNESADQAIWPTPVVGMLGLLEEADTSCGIGFGAAGDIVGLLGDAPPVLDGSEYLAVVHGQVAGAPTIDLDAELAVQTVLRDLIQAGLLVSAHDCSDGGVAVAVAESAFAGGIGVRLEVDPSAERDDVALFGEAPSRIVISAKAAAWPDVERRAAAAGVPVRALGRVGGDRLRVGPIDVALDEAHRAWDQGLDAALAGREPNG
ncbi:MAG: phosphoribosylformylglycinamidine synthase subunit PurL [Chloroflexi bacterium]|nr:phosphoribosylformylglycinamidine synthase subunit PurL [Chloroflexota bacterium]